MPNYKAIIKKLQKHYSDAQKVAILSSSGNILHTSEKWNIKSDVKGFLASWTSGTAQSVTLDGIRYSVLQMEPERFIATNRHNKGHLVAASTPDGEKYMFAHIKAKAKGWVHLAYPALVRAAAMMEKGSNSKFIESEVELEKEENLEAMVETQAIDPTLKAEVEGLLEWIRNPEGLPYYLSYYLHQNDLVRISKLAELYGKLYKLFYPE